MIGNDSKSAKEEVRKITTIPDRLSEAGELFKEKNKEYGDVFHHHGEILKALFPDGLYLKEDIDFSRFGMITLMLAKIERYCTNFFRGHKDSTIDLTVYASMLAELDAVKDIIGYTRRDNDKKECSSVTESDYDGDISIHDRVYYGREGKPGET